MNKIDYIDILGLEDFSVKIDADEYIELTTEGLDLSDAKSRVNILFLKRDYSDLESLSKSWNQVMDVLIFHMQMPSAENRKYTGKVIVENLLMEIGDKSIPHMIFQEEDSLTIYLFKNVSLYNKYRKSMRTSVIVPVYNEEKTISNVIESLLKSDLVDELVVVDDGSTDNTYKIINSFKDNKIKILSSNVNHGKGYAVSHGIRHTSGDIICMIDADLENLDSSHINMLTTPLILSNSQIMGVLGIRTNKTGNPKFRKLTGERAYYKKDLLHLLPVIEKTRYGIETVINYHFKNKHVLYIGFPDIKHYIKTQKNIPIDRVVQDYVKEAIEIAYQSSRLELDNQSKQIIRLMKLRKLNKYGEKVLEKGLTVFTDSQIKYIFKDYLEKLEGITNRRKNKAKRR